MTASTNDTRPSRASSRNPRVSARIEGVPEPTEVAALRAHMADQARLRRDAGKLIGVYAGIPDFVARHGLGWVGPAELPSNLRYRAPKQCFANSFDLVRRAPHRYQYVEGVVWAPTLPMALHHAWAIRRSDNRLIDLTLHPRFHGDGPWVYLGVPFPWELVYAASTRAKTRGAILDDWRNGYPLFEKVYEVSAA